MTAITLGTGQTVNLEVAKGASGRNAIQAVVKGLGLQPGQQFTPVEAAGDGEVSNPQALDTTQQTDPNEPNDGEVQPQRLDLTAHGDELVEVQVDGQKVVKSLSDVLGGYMRQSDYTRKTQELAEQRRTLEEGISQEDRQLLELGRTVASNADARQAVADALGANDSQNPEDVQSRRIQKLEAKLDEQTRMSTAEKQIAALVEAHPESQEHLQDIVQEMRRTGSRDPITTWRALDYSNVPERVAEKVTAERLRKAEAATVQSVVSTPSGAASGSETPSEIPVRDGNNQILTGRDYIRSMLKKGIAA